MSEAPLFSIVIPVKGRLLHLQKSLVAACAQPGAEVIVVDYDCPEGSGAWARQSCPQVKVISASPEPIFNAARARNLGASAATGTWLVLMDVDIVLHPFFLATLAQGLQAGEFYPAWPRNSGFAGFLVVRREAFQRMGGFDPEYRAWGHEDDDALMALRSTGLIGRTIDPHFIGTHLWHDEESRMKHYGDVTRRDSRHRNAARFAAKWGIPPAQALAHWPGPTLDATIFAPPRQPETIPAHRLGMRRIFLPEAEAFNGALLKTPAGTLLAYRVPPSCACVWLEDDFSVRPGTHQPLQLWRNDDPRLIQCRGETYLSTSYHGGGFKHERMELRRLWGKPGEMRMKVIGKFETIENDPRYVRVREKNWAPFAHEDRLLYVHHVRPHRILEVDLDRGSVRLLHETTWELPEWWRPEEWGETLRLNSPPLRLDGDRYLSTLHTWHRREYRTWFYTFSSRPPFAVESISSEPVILPQDAVGRNERNRRHDCVFITGLQIDHGRHEVLLTGGNNDRFIMMIAFDLREVMTGLRGVSQNAEPAIAVCAGA